MQIPHCVCAEIQKACDLRKVKGGDWKNTSNVVGEERSKDHGSGVLP